MDECILKSLGAEEQQNSSKIRVLQLVTGLGVGGAERVVLELTKAMNEQGIKTFIVALKNDKKLLEQYVNADISVQFLGIRKNPWSIVKAITILLKIISRERINVIHAHMFHPLVVATMCKILRPKCKLVFTSHSFKGFSWFRRMVIFFSKKMRDADILFIANQHHKMNAKRTSVIPNGVNVDQFNHADNNDNKLNRIFLSTGRLESVKNHISLIHSFASMRNKQCELWIAGDGILWTFLEKEIEKIGIQNRVKMLGIRHDIPKLLAQVDCFVMSSHWEGLPVALLEAGAAALPVISTPVGAISELLDGNCGYLVDVSELHMALDAVVDDYAEAQQRGRMLREKINRNYSVTHMCKAHINLYENLLTSVSR